MSDFEIQDELIVKKKRPVFLLVLVILSSLNISVSLLGSFSGMLGAKPDAKMIKQAKLEFANMREQLEEGGAADFTYIIDQMEGITNNMFKYFQAYNSVQFLILVLGLTGVILMYQRRKLGFHFYIIYSLGLVVLPYLFNPITGIPTILSIVGILYGGVWVLLYSRNLHWMEA
ncbi:MAG: hypothetical protein RL762_1273 [Bacteroidota bacterium]|jgi:hypothetical protein